MVFYSHSKYIARVLPLKPSKLLNLFCVPILAQEEVLNALLFLHV